MDSPFDSPPSSLSHSFPDPPSPALHIFSNQVTKAKKKATEEAEVSSFGGKAFCVTYVNIGTDNAAICEAVVKVTDQKGMAIEVISKDKITNEVVVCDGVPKKCDGYKQLNVKEWLIAALVPLNGKGGKGSLAQGQGSDMSHVVEVINIVDSFATTKLN